MDGLRIHHYGFATGDLDASSQAFARLGYRVGEVVVDPIQRVRIVFASRGDETPIELVADIDEHGPTSRIVSRGGNGFYHVCYEVSDIAETAAALRPSGCIALRAPVPAAAFDGRRIAWMYGRSLGLIELLERAAHEDAAVDGAGR
jgi:methylmalonyl-CoA/ethylmalonyl-CoA epimerase